MHPIIVAVSPATLMLVVGDHAAGLAVTVGLRLRRLPERSARRGVVSEGVHRVAVDLPDAYISISLVRRRNQISSTARCSAPFAAESPLISPSTGSSGIGRRQGAVWGSGAAVGVDSSRYQLLRFALPSSLQAVRARTPTLSRAASRPAINCTFSRVTAPTTGGTRPRPLFSADGRGQTPGAVWSVVAGEAGDRTSPYMPVRSASSCGR